MKTMWAKVKAVAATALAVGIIGHGGVALAAAGAAGTGNGQTPDVTGTTQMGNRGREVPAAIIEQVIRSGDKEMAKISFGRSRAGAGKSMQVIGDYIYESDVGGVINHFKIDAQTGLLAFAGSATNSVFRGNAILRVAGGRLYAYAMFVWGDSEIFGLAWYDVDPKTGALTEKQTIVDPRTRAYLKKELIADPVFCGDSFEVDSEGRNLYAQSPGDGKLYWYKIEADGKPVKAGEASGKGTRNARGVRISPDGKSLYVASKDEGCLVGFQRSPTGEIAYQGSFSLAPVVGGELKGYEPAIAGISPDGKWLYVAMRSAVGPGAFAAYKREPATGELTLSASVTGAMSDDLRLSNLTGLRLLFLPDGSGGFTENASGVLESFRVDKETGRLHDVTDTPDFLVKCLSATSLILDPKKGLLYGCGGGGTTGLAQSGNLWVAKIGKAEVAGERSDVQATTAAGDAARPGNEVDWPRWLGPRFDNHNPTKGIRRDWAGGLKKVWEVKGLSPGTSTFSAPSVTGNKLVVMGQHGIVIEVFCFDADKGGAPLWISEFTGGDGSDYGWGNGPTGAPCVDGDKLYVSSKGGNFACLNMADGKVLWKKDLACGCHGYSATPLPWGDLAIISGGEHKQLTAYKKSTGEKVWSYGEGSKVPENAFSHNSALLAVFDGKEQVVHHTADTAFGLDPGTGNVLWLIPDMPHEAIPSQVISGNIIFQKTGAAIRIEGGKANLLWKGYKGDKGTFGSGMSDPIIVGDYAYAIGGSAMWNGAAKGGMICVELKTGNVKWTENTGNGSMVLVDGCLLCLTYSGDLMLVDPSPDGFKKITEWKKAIPDTIWWHQGGRYGAWGHDFALCWTMPVVARGKIYLRLNDKLTSYDLMK